MHLEKKIKILLLVCKSDFQEIQLLTKFSKDVEFICYESYIDGLSLPSFLLGVREDFDFAATYNSKRYDFLRGMMERYFTGPKILIDSAGQYIPKSSLYNIEVVIPVSTKKFESMVVEEFQRLHPLQVVWTDEKMHSDYSLTRTVSGLHR